jgi:hypothetical protein
LSDKERVIEERRQRFIKKYKEAFGVEPELKPLMSDDEKLESGEYTLTLNFYGIKSNWM